MNRLEEKPVSMAELAPLMQERLRQGGCVELSPTGDSMRPLLFDRKSKVRLAQVRSPRRGDVVLYQRENGQYVLHRIVAVGELLCMCGDAQWRCECGIRREQIFAVMTDFTRHGHWVSCENGFYRAYWKIWLALRPLRRLIAGGIRYTEKMLRRQ